MTQGPAQAAKGVLSKQMNRRAQASPVEGSHAVGPRLAGKQEPTFRYVLIHI